MPPNAVMVTLAKLWRALEAEQIQVAVAGGLALSYWGNPRSTQDVDLAIYLSDLEQVTEVLQKQGFKRISQSLKDLGIFKLDQWTFEPEDEYVIVEIDLLLGTGDYMDQACSRIVKAKIDSMTNDVFVLSREDLLLQKLYAGRMIDLADAVQLLENNKGELNISYLRDWSQKLGVADELLKLLPN